MRNLIFSITFLFCFQNIIGQTKQEGNFTGKRSNLESSNIGLLSNTDSLRQIEDNDTITIVYKYFTVTKKMIETSEDISIYPNGKSTAILHNSNYYFLGIKNDRYAIFDEGTTATRGLMIYDLVDKREILNIVYQENLSIEENSIHYKTEVKIDDRKLRPKCPPDLENLSNRIYLEEQYFNFEDLKIMHTGKYICSFME